MFWLMSVSKYEKKNIQQEFDFRNERAQKYPIKSLRKNTNILAVIGQGKVRSHKLKIIV